MAKQRIISTKLWSDPWVVDDLNPLDRYLFLYLLTNEKTNIVGVYELSLRTMANETGIDREELQRMLIRLESRVIYLDGYVVFRKAIKHQNFKSPKIESAIARELSNVPSTVVQHVQMPDDLGQLLHDIYGIDTVSIGYTSDIALNNNNNNNNNSNNNNNNQRDSSTSAVAKATRLEPVDKKIIDEMIERWNEIVELPAHDNVSNRRAIAALFRQHGHDKLLQLIRGVQLALDDKYAPRIGDFVSLKRKQNDLLIWGRKQNSMRITKI